MMTKQKSYNSDHSIVHLLILALCLMFSVSTAQTPKIIDGKLGGVLPLDNGDVVYKETYQTPGVSKEELFRRLRRWWAVNYRSAKDVLQISDEKTGELVGKGYRLINEPDKNAIIKFYIYSTAAIDLREESYTIRIDNFLLYRSLGLKPTELQNYDRSSEKNLTKSLTAIDLDVKTMLKSLNDAALKGE